MIERRNGLSFCLQYYRSGLKTDEVLSFELISYSFDLDKATVVIKRTNLRSGSPQRFCAVKFLEHCLQVSD